MNFLTIKKSSNRKTGPIPVTYGSRKTCPPSCPHYEDDCYGEDFHTSLAWNRVDRDGVQLPGDRKSTRLNSSHSQQSRMPSSA